MDTPCCASHEGKGHGFGELHDTRKSNDQIGASGVSGLGAVVRVLVRPKEQDGNESRSERRSEWWMERIIEI